MLIGLPHLVLEMARALRDAGGRAFLVGGWVRDRVATRTADERPLPETDNFDMEVYGLAPDTLRRALQRFGRVNLVGESFAVYKVTPPGIEKEHPVVDVSLPRRDTKVGAGHRGFEVSGDPHLSYEEATRRRDFTINAMMLDPLDGALIDPWDGRRDLDRCLLRAVDPKTFVEDSLRVLRAVQMAARFEFDIEEATARLCRGIDLSDLPAERIQGEMEKLLLKARRPSKGLEWADRLGVVDRLFPELAALKGCEQEPEWHPEGDVWVHTLLAIDRAAEESAALSKEKRLAVMLAVLCHDFGKPATTAFVDGRIRSHEHEEAGIEPTAAFLDRLKIQTLNGYPLRAQVIELVARHLTPSHWFKNRDKVGDGAVRRLAKRLEPELLYHVSRADCLGRTGDFSTEAQEWFIERVRGLGVEERPPGPILMGRHLLEMGLRPGPIIGRITKAVYEKQLDGSVADLEQAQREARRLLDEEVGD
ncbi:MAG: HD domain-containing protein [Acidobacteriota bacterium]